MNKTLTSRLKPASRVVATKSRHSATTRCTIRHVTLQSCRKTQPQPRLSCFLTRGNQCVCKLVQLPNENQPWPARNRCQSVQLAAISFVLSQKPHNILPDAGLDRPCHHAHPCSPLNAYLRISVDISLPQLSACRFNLNTFSVESGRKSREAVLCARSGGSSSMRLEALSHILRRNW